MNLPDGAIAIQIDAGQAFGTGNHEATRGCLQSIEKVVQITRRPIRWISAPAAVFWPLRSLSALAVL